MKLIIPMAGMGKRMRPHTLTTPKPLIPIAGKSIVQRLIEEINTVLNQKITEISFVIGDFPEEVVDKLKNISKELNAIPKIYYQDDPLGTAHAVYCAKPSLNGEVIVAFADTLFKTDFQLDEKADGIIWTKEVPNPNQYGVIKLDKDNYISDFIEKPKEFVSNKAIIGIYYFRNAEKLNDEIKYLIDNKVLVNNEYQLTDALENLKNKDFKFRTQTVTEWLDCGSKNITLKTTQRVLFHLPEKELIDSTADISGSIVKKPCFIGKNVKITNSIIGPYVSIEQNTEINNSIISNSLIQSNTIISNKLLTNSMLGNYVKISGNIDDLNIGDYTEI